jgi:hypothetical protein
MNAGAIAAIYEARQAYENLKKDESNLIMSVKNNEDYEYKFIDYLYFFELTTKLGYNNTEILSSVLKEEQENGWELFVVSSTYRIGVRRKKDTKPNPTTLIPEYRTAIYAKNYWRNIILFFVSLILIPILFAALSS